MYQANEARKEYEDFLKLTDVEKYYRKNEKSFEWLGNQIKNQAHLGSKNYSFFDTFYVRTFKEESELYKKVLESFGYKVEYIKPRNEKDLDNKEFYYVQYIVSISW